MKSFKLSIVILSTALLASITSACSEKRESNKSATPAQQTSTTSAAVETLPKQPAPINGIYQLQYGSETDNLVAFFIHDAKLYKWTNNGVVRTYKFSRAENDGAIILDELYTLHVDSRGDLQITDQSAKTTHYKYLRELQAAHISDIIAYEERYKKLEDTYNNQLNQLVLRPNYEPNKIPFSDCVPKEPAIIKAGSMLAEKECRINLIKESNAAATKELADMEKARVQLKIEQDKAQAASEGSSDTVQVKP